MLFISPQNFFSFSRDLNFCLDFLVMQQNGLIRKIILIWNFMTSQPGYQTIVIHIFRNISWSKDNQTLKFGQLIEYNMRNIFLKKSYTKCGGETSPKNLNWAYLWINGLKSYIVCFYWMLSWGLSIYIETTLQSACFYLILSFFKK